MHLLKEGYMTDLDKLPHIIKLQDLLHITTQVNTHSTSYHT